MEGLVRRITPMAVLDDIGPTLDRYAVLGFETVGTGTSGCVGVRAKDGTAMILASTRYLRGELDPDIVARLAGQIFPYVWVHSLEKAENRLGAAARVLGRIAHKGIREALVLDGESWLMLAETTTETGPAAEL